MPMSEEQIKELVEPIGDLFWMLEKRTRDRIADRLGQIGKLTASDIHELERLADLGADIADIEKEIATATGLAQEEIHNIILEAAQAARDYNRALAAEKTGEYLAEMQKEGLEVTILTPEQKEEFKKVMMPVWEKYHSVVGRGLIDKVVNTL